MAEYYSINNHRGKAGVSAQAIGHLARLSADSVSGIRTESKSVSARIYGDLIKVIVGVAISEGSDVLAKCQEVKEEVTRAIVDQLEVRQVDVRVTSLGTYAD